MLRLESNTGWCLVTHVDHARLAGMFAIHWGNALFIRPEPRDDVMEGISTHDDGWEQRDSAPEITKQGKPSAFSSELVGKYSAFEEIDLPDYLAVRESAVQKVAAKNLYAGLLVSMHTYDLLQNRADHSTIAADQLPLLESFLRSQQEFQATAKKELAKMNEHAVEDLTEERIADNFHLLQACDNLSLLTCVDYRSPANLLHALPIKEGGRQSVSVEHLGERHFQLSPYPFSKSPLTIHFPARFVQSSRFTSNEKLREEFNKAAIERLSVTLDE
jgi:Mn-dependent DtxR family transcriptional regulator